MSYMDFDAPTLAELRSRRSAKWRTYPPDVLPVWVAETDVRLADPIRQALHAAIDRDDTGYSHLDELRETVVDWLADKQGWKVGFDDVLGAPDVMVGIAEVLRAVTEPGDPVVLNPPVYPPFFATINAIGRRVVEVPLLSADGDWALDLDGLRDAFAAGARTYLMCSPHNPVGAVWPAETLAEVARLAERYGVTVLADEIHAPLTLTGARHTPYATVPGAAEHCVVLTSASKAWNLAGLKCAVAVTASERMRSALRQIPNDLHWQVSHLGSIAMVAALRDGQPWLDELLPHLDRNRTLLAELLAKALPEVGYQPPQASYLGWLDCRALDLGPDPAAAFLDRGRVALTAGSAFGAPGAGHVRLNLGTTREVLTEAVDRMSRVR
ncbi:MAG TPA: aminotransferase class I/II-fold pyridoxal phosphate-dependent enzyme [Mycobacteriales bacterium]|jgi:cystathionine beta-lyase|nr:aminotransferase class I/II-fold pyridoxal phosphate-dependent enzyme [Mycobacteriales bacterium]